MYIYCIYTGYIVEFMTIINLKIILRTNIKQSLTNYVGINNIRSIYMVEVLNATTVASLFTSARARFVTCTSMQ